MKKYIINEQLRGMIINALRLGTFNVSVGQVMDIINAVTVAEEYIDSAEQNAPKEKNEN